MYLIKQKKKNNNVNDNSQSLSLNYNNIFKENRYFGTDEKEDGSRIVLALEQKHQLTNKINLELNYGRSYNLDRNVKFLEDINQKSKLSDHLTEISFNYKNHKLKYNTRLDEKNFNIKEDILTYEIENDKNSLLINKSLTNSKAFINSDSSHFMTTEFTRKINKNTNFKYVSEVNLGDNNKIYSEEYKIELFDNCSQLDLVYSVDNYNDGKDLKPNKTLSLTYEMDFLSGFNDEQRVNSIF